VTKLREIKCVGYVPLTRPSIYLNEISAGNPERKIPLARATRCWKETLNWVSEKYGVRIRTVIIQLRAGSSGGIL